MTCPKSEKMCGTYLGVKKNLISIGQLVEKDMDVLFNKYGCTITSSNTGEVLVTGRNVVVMYFVHYVKKLQ